MIRVINAKLFPFSVYFSTRATEHRVQREIVTKSVFTFTRNNKYESKRGFPLAFRKQYIYCTLTSSLRRIYSALKSNPMQISSKKSLAWPLL